MRYIKLKYKIEFDEEPLWGNPPAFVLRSILGLSLRRLTCILRQQETCFDCMVKDSCIYSTFFETNVDKTLSSLEGRNKAAHPFVIDVIELNEHSMIFEIMFIERAINYIPYINIALENAGKLGMGKNRVKFALAEVLNGDSLFSYDDIKDNNSHWPRSMENKEVHAIVLETPCRIKKQGHYSSDFTLEDLLKSIALRMNVLSELFAENEDLPEICFTEDMNSELVNPTWKEMRYYSGRQQSVMKLGGVTGVMIIKSELSECVKEYIDAMELFHVGKNISFGYGKIKVVY